MSMDRTTPAITHCPLVGGAVQLSVQSRPTLVAVRCVDRRRVGFATVPARRHLLARNPCESFFFLLGALALCGARVLYCIEVRMSDKHLLTISRVCYDKPNSGRASDKAWWYEEAGGVCVVINQPQLRGSSLQVYLRWGQLEQALKRKRR